MISFSTLTYDPEGSIYLYASDIDASRSKLNDISRRATRTAALNGGSVLFDSGFSNEDRRLTVSFRAISAEKINTIKRLVILYSEITVSLAEGCFKACPVSLSESSGLFTLTLLVTGVR